MKGEESVVATIDTNGYPWSISSCIVKETETLHPGHELKKARPISVNSHRTTPELVLESSDEAAAIGH